MIDFLIISERVLKNGTTEVYPKFRIYPKSQDLMIRGGDFYAAWIEELGLWSTNEDDVLHLIDRELQAYGDAIYERAGGRVSILKMQDSDSGMVDIWHKYCQRQLRDSYQNLDEKLIFSNTEVNKKDYASKRLPYPLEEGDISAWDKLISTLYDEEERHKIEWAIGAIVTGDSKHIQKFITMYGAPGTGKSTILNVIQQLFQGYDAVFDAKALGSATNAFALEAFNTNPLVAIQHDGDLSKIEDNTRLNSVVSHEVMRINEKFKATYSNRFIAFLFLGTNKPVKITDAKSGIIRRLIDVSPSGRKLGAREYKTTVKQVGFELGAIAYHCMQVYLEDPGYYDDYIPVSMMSASNDFYNFVIDSYHIFVNEDGTTLQAAWDMYKNYCDDAKVPYPLTKRTFKEELKNYFREFNDRFNLEDGSRVRSYYSGFKTDIFERDMQPEQKPEPKSNSWLKFEEQSSIFDKDCKDCPAQYANDSGTPTKAWAKVKTKLSSLDTSKLHFVKVPENHIVIDFDIKDKDGNKSFEKNFEEASKWPPTYAELSKSGGGIHLHYIYSGDPSKLSRVYDDAIEVKVQVGDSSLRRKLTKCNALAVATISSGLPLKGEKMIQSEVIQTEKGLRTTIKKCLNKEVHSGTKPNVDFIYKILEDAYNSGLHYDVSDMKDAVVHFAMNSTNQAGYCLKLVQKMQFKSDEASEHADNNEAPLVFYDIEVFPNLFLVNWKVQGEGRPVVRMINPAPSEIEELMKMRLVGFNCRRYDNHVLYARYLGYNNEELYNLSQTIVTSKKGENKNCFFREAYNISYTDVYDFAAKKQSLKKWEIELGIHHQELGLAWDKPVPEDRWIEVAEYCDNDVIATEAVFNHLKADFTARKILAEIAGLSVNDTTNSLTTRIIFGKNRNPQSVFNYRDMGDESQVCFDIIPYAFDEEFDKYTVFDKEGRPIFPGYKYEGGISTYRDEEVGEGGYVYAEPGIHTNVALLDVASMHPASVIAEQLFGPEFTKRFQEIRDARVAIKHKDFDTARKMLGGVLAKYLDDPQIAKDLAQALKIAINSVYGLTAAKFPNPFHDVRNKDNIVAKRGALFMVNLKHEVQKRGFTVAHIKTDSIKIPDATPEIIKFVMDYGKMYGYTFEHEATYDRMCLVNDAVYIARYKNDDGTLGEWTATGAQFAVPYVYKKLFTREPIVFEDMCETKSVTSALYLNDPSDEEVIYDAETGNETILLKGNAPEFVGRVGQFCPIKPGCGGKELLREDKDSEGNVKYAAAVGTKGYFWLESEAVKLLEKEDDIDRSYYDALVDAAVDVIASYGDFEWFVSDNSEVGDVPPWNAADEPWDEASAIFDRR